MKVVTQILVFQIQILSWTAQKLHKSLKGIVEHVYE